MPSFEEIAESTDDPYLQVMIGIGSELAGIRLELQRLNARLEGSENAEAEEAFECRCGEIAHGEGAAKRHAIEEHNAPAEHWRELYA